MYKDLDETIGVTALFKKGQMTPLYFYWQNRSFKVKQVSGTWKAPKGDKWMRHYSVVDASDNVYFLCYDERAMRWAISKVWVG